ncbi:hypothetical protein N7533_002882 [Penicillium manginii]|uniref:uncharacterized protein n=1 Tax=Penicillium manginii TaxID=203109 RepID=UPI002547413B|nr:uncharacterized protein N7533_002882 [Penicillium manginii]KAJ5764201.1 hypothetical protein N7533_002882 [Penicillium manginii]
MERQTSSPQMTPTSNRKSTQGPRYASSATSAQWEIIHDVKSTPVEQNKIRVFTLRTKTHTSDMETPGPHRTTDYATLNLPRREGIGE